VATPSKQETIKLLSELCKDILVQQDFLDVPLPLDPWRAK